MKNMTKKIKLTFLRLIPIFSGLMLFASVNATACWIHGQDELPPDAKRFRKF